MRHLRLYLPPLLLFLPMALLGCKLLFTPVRMPLTETQQEQTGATGLIDNGPDAPTPIRLALDNTAASGNLTYVIDPAANGGKFANFGGLAIKRTHVAGGAVIAKLLPNGSTVLRTPTLSISGAQGANAVATVGTVLSATGQAMRRTAFPNLTRLRRDAHPGTEGCWLHAERFCLSMEPV